jgi:hypothetical protein
VETGLICPFFGTDRKNFYFTYAQAHLPGYAVDLGATIGTRKVFDLIFQNLVAVPANESFPTFVAVGVFSSFARDISFIDIS